MINKICTHYIALDGLVFQLKIFNILVKIVQSRKFKSMC